MGFGKKLEFDKGIYQILLFGDILKGNCNFYMEHLAEIWGVTNSGFKSNLISCNFKNEFFFFFFLASSIVQLPSTFSNSTVFRLISLSLNQCLTFTLFLTFYTIPYSLFFAFILTALEFIPWCQTQTWSDWSTPQKSCFWKEQNHLKHLQTQAKLLRHAIYSTKWIVEIWAHGT